MSYFRARNKKTFSLRCLCLLLSIAFLLNFVFLPRGVNAQLTAESTFSLPLPGTMMGITKAYDPPLLTGVVINPDDPLEFEFMVNNGDSDLEGEAFQREAEKLIKYFLVSLTIPEEKMWVNLSPYEENQMISAVLGETEMGRDLLGQDYILKQLSASMMNPKDALGKSFWDKVYDKAYELYGTKDIPINTFNKVWIIPEKATVYENEVGAFVIDSHLKVMLEEDYVALQKNMGNAELRLDETRKDDAKQISEATTEVMREVMIPEIEKEVNTGSTFANLRQIYNSMILGAWYKANLKESFLGQVYVNQNKIDGVDLEDPAVKEQIFDQYLTAFQKGVYNHIERKYDPQTNEIIIQKYFSGGFDGAQIPNIVNDGGLRSFTAVAEINPATAALQIMQLGTSTNPEAAGLAREAFNTLPTEKREEVRAVMNKMASSPITSFKVKLAPQRRTLDREQIITRSLQESDVNVELGSIAGSRVPEGMVSSVDRQLNTLSLESGTSNIPSQMAQQRVAFATAVQSEIGKQGKQFDGNVVNQAADRVMVLITESPEINAFQTRETLISEGIDTGIVGVVTDMAFRTANVPDQIMERRDTLVTAVQAESQRQGLEFDGAAVNQAAGRVMTLAMTSPEKSFSAVVTELELRGVDTEMARVMTDMAFGVTSSASNIPDEVTRQRSTLEIAATTVLSGQGRTFDQGEVTRASGELMELTSNRPGIGSSEARALLVERGVSPTIADTFVEVAFGETAIPVNVPDQITQQRTTLVQTSMRELTNQGIDYNQSEIDVVATEILKLATTDRDIDSAQARQALGSQGFDTNVINTMVDTAFRTTNAARGVAQQSDMLATAVKSEFRDQGIVQNESVINLAANKMVDLTVKMPDINLPEATHALVSMDIERIIAQTTASKALGRSSITMNAGNEMTRQRAKLSMAVESALGSQGIPISSEVANQAAGRMMETIIRSPEMAFSQARDVLVAEGFETNVAETTADVVFGQRGARFESFRSDATKLSQFKSDVKAVVNLGPASISIPIAEQSNLDARNSSFSKARQTVRQIESGQLTRQDQQVSVMISEIEPEVNRIVSTFHEATSLDQQISLFYQVQDATALVGQLKGQDVNVPILGLPLETRAQIDQATPSQLREMYVGLNKQLTGIRDVGKSISASSDLDKKESFANVINTYANKITSDIQVVNLARRKSNEATQITQNFDNPNGLREIVNNAIEIQDTNRAANEISQANKIFAVDSNMRASEIGPSAAIDTFARNQSTVRLTPENNVMLMTTNTERTNMTERQQIASIEPVRFRSTDMAATVERVKSMSTPETLGGIDLNPTMLDLDIKVDGNGVILPLSEQPIDVTDIQGFVPVILDMNPASVNMPMLLGQPE